jgi:hypothetical protein
MSAEKGSFREAPVGGPGWSTAFRDAIKQAISDAVEEHLKAGNPVYFTNDDGDIYELSPDRNVRKLTPEELKLLTGG